jgi:carbamoylphosphate synthase small subunit
MKKILCIIASLVLTVGAMAQTDTRKKDGMKDLRTDVRQQKAAKHKVNNDLSHVKLKKAAHDHKAVAVQNKDIRKDARSLRNKGVSHPVAKAKRQVRVQDDNKKDHTQ